MNLFNRHTGTSPVLRDLLSRSSQHYAFHAQGEDHAQIDVFGEIDDWWGFGVRQMALDMAGAGTRPLTVRIHSPGGLITEGLGIRNLIRGYPGTTTTQAVGWAASIASVILLAGDRVEMAENSFLMIHRPWSMMIGDADEARQQADLLDKMGDNLAGIYTAAILARKDDADEDATRAQVLEWMAAETWFTAAEALDAGLIDGITEAVDFVDENTAADEMAALNKYSNAPPQLRAQIRKKISNAMSDKKTNGLLAQLRALLVEDVEEPEATTEENPAPPSAQVDLDAARQALEAEGFQITAPQEAQAEDETAEEEEEGHSEAAEEAAEVLASLRDEVAQLRAQIKRRAGAPSGGGTGDKQARTTDPKRVKVFDSFVPAVIKYARDNS